MKKVILLFIILISTISLSVGVHASSEVDNKETITQEEKDSIKESADFYVKLIAEFSVALGGIATGLSVFHKKVDKTNQEVKEGTKTLKEAKKEIEEHKKELHKEIEDFINATKELKVDGSTLMALILPEDGIIETLKNAPEYIGGSGRTDAEIAGVQQRNRGEMSLDAKCV